VAHFGHWFDYHVNQLNTPPHQNLPIIPDWLSFILNRVYAQFDLTLLDQVTLSKYPVGTGIPPHVDSHLAFGDAVFALSLASDAEMEFRHVETREKRRVDLLSRSLLILKGEARYAWEHCIRERLTDELPDGKLRERRDRISITMRRGEPKERCHCSWQKACMLRHRSLSAG